jgi:hypothetical protein
MKHAKRQGHLLIPTALLLIYAAALLSAVGAFFNTPVKQSAHNSADAREAHSGRAVTHQNSSRNSNPAPLRFARFKHLFIEPSSVLIPQAVLPNLSQRFTLNATTHRLYLLPFPFEGKIQVYDTRTDQRIAEVPIQASSIWDLWVHPQTHKLCARVEERQLYVLNERGDDFDKPKLRWIYDSDSIPLYALFQDSNPARSSTPPPAPSIASPYTGHWLYFEQAGRILLVKWLTRTLMELDARTGVIERELHFGPTKIKGLTGPGEFVFAPEMGRIYLAEKFGQAVLVVDPGQLRVVARIPLAGFPYFMAANPRTHRIFVSSEGDFRVFIIDTRTNRVIASPECDDVPVTIAVDPELSKVYINIGKFVVVCQERG